MCLALCVYHACARLNICLHICTAQARTSVLHAPERETHHGGRGGKEAHHGRKADLLPEMALELHVRLQIVEVQSEQVHMRRHAGRYVSREACIYIRASVKHG